MKRNFLFSLLTIIVTLVFIWGFSSSNNPYDRDPNATKEKGTYLVKGPELDNPLSTLSESFEGATFPPAGWIKINPDGGPGWNRQTNGTTPVPGFQGGVITIPPGGGNACAFESWNTGGAASSDQWLVTPQITNVQANDSLNFYLRYWPNSYRDSIEVKISTTTPTVAAMTILVWRKNFAVNTPDTNWVQYNFSIGSLVPAGSNIYIGFREVVADNQLDGATFSLDLVNVTAATPPPVCTYTWTPQTSGTSVALYGISAVNNNVAWASGVGNTIRRTVNGGVTWTSANGGGLTGGDVYDIAALDSDNAVATTSNMVGTIIYKTTNGGANWVSVYTQVAPGFINDIDMVSATEGYAEGDPVGGVWTVLRTTNGGTNWTAIPGAPASGAGEAGRLDNMSIVGNNIHFASDASKVYNSTNQGANWTSVTVPAFPVTGANPVCLHFMDANTGFVGSQSLQKTTDAGSTWAPVTVPGTGDFYNIDGVGNDTWVLRVSIVYRSTNFGTNWANVFNGSGTLEDIDLAINGSCPIGWVVSSTGNVAKMTSTTVGITPINNEIPKGFVLSQNYPNPFNPSTNISFALPKSGFVTLKVYDMVGKEVATLVNESKTAGNYIIGFNASNLPSGVYFYKIESSNFVDTKKMLLIK
jgi:photosystem II stability/assembly factor-like uncharacterized protein